MFVVVPTPTILREHDLRDVIVIVVPIMMYVTKLWFRLPIYFESTRYLSFATNDEDALKKTAVKTKGYGCFMNLDLQTVV